MIQLSIPTSISPILLSVNYSIDALTWYENSVENDVQFCSYTRNEYGYRRKRDNLDEKRFKM